MGHDSRQSTEHQFTSFDGTQLFFRAWLPNSGLQPGGRAVIMFHRGHEHSGRLAHVADELGLPEHALFAWDQRGHGRSPGERGYARHAMDLVRDIDSFVRHITESYGIPVENVVVIAHSVSAVLAASWVQSFAPRIRALVLVTPAFSVKLYVPFALPALRLRQFVQNKRRKGTFFVKSYVSGKMLTHDPDFAKSYDSDPLVSKQIAANILIDLFDMSRRVLADAGAIVTPTLVLAARADWVVKNKPIRRFYDALSSTFKRVAVFRDMFHGILHEREREPVVAAIRAFIEEAEALPVDRGALKEAHRTGYSHSEYQWLNAGLPMLSLKRFGYIVQRAALKSLGQLSDGISLGWRTGFDSGQSLDYVYTNTPRGEFGLGKLFDEGYLNSVGWRGIRQRKVNLEHLLNKAIATKLEEIGDRPLRVVDVAGGPGRYLLDVVEKLPAGSCEVLIRDWSDSGLAEGRRIASDKGVTGVRYEKGDAFSPDSLAELGTADIVVVSGLYELFPDNGQVERSLGGLAKVIPTGGYLIYTGQPWHPQLEMIAEVLVNREGKPWIMRRRTQAELDELVRAQGFEKRTMLLDDDGIFTVSLALKR